MLWTEVREMWIWNRNPSKKGFLDHNEVKNYTLDKYRVTGKDSKEKFSILTLTFQLNQLLMLINNPIQFPHLAYVEMFNSLHGDKR